MQNYWFTGGGHNAKDYTEQAPESKRGRIHRIEIRPVCTYQLFYGEDLASNLTLDSRVNIEPGFRCIEAVTDAVGPEFDIMIETHAMLNYRVAVKMAERLAKLDITWYEEPARPESSQTLRVCVNVSLRMWAICVENAIIPVSVFVLCWKNMSVT